MLQLIGFNKTVLWNSLFLNVFCFSDVQIIHFLKVPGNFQLFSIFLQIKFALCSETVLQMLSRSMLFCSSHHITFSWFLDICCNILLSRFMIFFRNFLGSKPGTENVFTFKMYSSNLLKCLIPIVIVSKLDSTEQVCLTRQ